MTLKVSNQIIPFLAKEGNVIWSPLKKNVSAPAKLEGIDALVCREQRAESCSTKSRNLTLRRDLPSLSLPSLSPIGHLQAHTVTTHTHPTPPGSCFYFGLELLSRPEVTGRRARSPEGV